MRKFLILGAALATLGAGALPTAATADDRGALVGAGAGATTGGTIGFLIGGPIGAVVGGTVGAAIGASVLSSDDIASGNVDIVVGAVVDDDVVLRPVDGQRGYGYFRADGHTYIVDVETREIVEIRIS